jgi:hypothetical protein
MGQSLYCWRARAAKSQNEKCKKQNDRAKIKILNARERAYDHEMRSIWNQYHNAPMRLIAFATGCNNFSALL